MNHVVPHEPARGDRKTDCTASEETLTGSVDKGGLKKRKGKTCTGVPAAGSSGSKKVQKGPGWMQDPSVIMMMRSIPGNLFP